MKKIEEFTREEIKDALEDLRDEFHSETSSLCPPTLRIAIAAIEALGVK